MKYLKTFEKIIHDDGEQVVTNDIKEWMVKYGLPSINLENLKLEEDEIDGIRAEQEADKFNF